MIQRIQEELKKINWTSLAIGAVIGVGVYYLCQKYTVKDTEKLKNKPLRV